MATRTQIWPALALLAGCSKAPESLPAEPPVVEQENPPFFGLATRDHEIWMHAGPCYTIKKKDGTLLASQIDQATLERDYPELAADLSAMVDVNDGGQHFGIGVGGRD